MHPIQIKKDRPELKEQLNFLIKHEVKIVYRKYKKPFYRLIGCTFLTLLLIPLPDTEALIAGKGVMIFATAIFWIAAIMFMLPIVVRIYKRIVWRNKVIQHFLKDNGEAFMTFDNERIYFHSNTFKTELNWEYYTYYAFDKDSIFIVPANNIYEAFYCSRAEIGIDNFETLTAIVKERLKRLP